MSVNDHSINPATERAENSNNGQIDREALRKAHAAEKAAADERLIPNGLTVNKILNTDYGVQPWYVPGLITTGLWILAGLPKKGKSFLATQLINGVATGGDFMGRKCNKAKVLYIALEDNPRRLKDRLSKLNWRNAGDDVTIWLADDWKRYIGGLSDKSIVPLTEAIKSRGYELIVLDTLSRALAGQKADQLKADDVVAALDPLQAVATSLDISIGVLDHQAKNSRGNSDVEDVYGSIGKTGVADTVIVLREEKPDEFYMTASGRDIPARQMMQLARETNGFWRLVTDATNSPIKNPAERQVLEAIRANPDCKARDLRTLSNVRGSGVDEITHRLIRDGFVTTANGPKNAVLHTITESGLAAIGAQRIAGKVSRGEI